MFKKITILNFLNPQRLYRSYYENLINENNELMKTIK